MSLMGSLNVSASGMSAQRTRMDIISQNIANVNTTRNEFGEKQVYHKKQVNFKEMVMDKKFHFPKGNVSVEFDPPSEPYLVLSNILIKSILLFLSEKAKEAAIIAGSKA